MNNHEKQKRRRKHRRCTGELSEDFQGVAFQEDHQVVHKRLWHSLHCFRLFTRLKEGLPADPDSRQKLCIAQCAGQGAHHP